MRKISCFLILALAVFCGRAKADLAPGKPNIIVILAVDMGYSDLGSYGGEIETPSVFLSDNGCSAEGGSGGFNCGLGGASIGTGRSYASAGLEWANA